MFNTSTAMLRVVPLCFSPFVQVQKVELFSFKKFRYLVRNRIRYFEKPDFFEKVPYTVPETFDFETNFFENVPYTVPIPFDFETNFF